jgi:hypothetical protein
MNAKQLIDGIKRVCRENDISPEDVSLNYRHNFNSEVWCVKGVILSINEGGAVAQVTRHISAECAVTGQQFIDRLLEQCKRRKLDPKDARAVFLYGSGDSYPIRRVEEDLFDAESNRVLGSLVFVTDTRDQ